MSSHLRIGLIAGLTSFALACSGDDNSAGPGNTTFDAGLTQMPPASTPDTGVAAPVLDAGQTPTTMLDSGAAHDAGMTTSDGGISALVDSGALPQGDAALADAASGDAASAGGTSLTGTYGSLGAVKPVVSSVWIDTGLETIIYLSSTPLTCAQVMTEGGRWLLMLPSDGQVLEIVMRGAAKMGMFRIPSAEANYAQGSKSSSTEKVASSGMVTITNVAAKNAIDGMVSATYSSGSVTGSFHAEFCNAGQEW